MADAKISQLGELAAQPAATDEFVVVDKSDTTMAASGTDKKVQYSNLMGGAWQTWTPTFANFTKGSATITAKYIQLGKTVHFRLAVVLAADSSMGTSPTFTLPVTSVSYGTSGVSPIGVGTILDNGTATYRMNVIWSSTTVCSITIYNVASTYPIDAAITATVPMTWTTGDEFTATGTYEAA